MRKTSMEKTTITHIPLDKLVPSAANVRRTHRDAGITELAASITAHGLLQNLTALPQCDSEGNGTGKFEVLAGGRRLAALLFLVKQKKLKKDAPIPCHVRSGGIPKELSLAENAVRENLHPADQYEAFRELNEEHGVGAEDIAARFGVTTRIVKERLKLGSVSPKLLALYREGTLALDQIMAFTVNGDQARQEAAWDSLSWDKTPETIRATLLSSHVPASDKRARFVGLSNYEEAGGTLARDLFSEDDGGYLDDLVLLDRLVREKLDHIAEKLIAEGWKWAEIGLDFPHGHGRKRVYPEEMALDPAIAEKQAALESELADLQNTHGDGEDLDPDIERRFDVLEAELAMIEAKRWVFTPEDKARAGAFVTVGRDGEPKIAFGFVRPEDERAEERQPSVDGDDNSKADDTEGEEGTKRLANSQGGISERLVADLTAHRTAALRHALGSNPQIALIALTHALVLQCFYLGETDRSCLDVTIQSANLQTHVPKIGENDAMRRIHERHEYWGVRLPRNAADLWSYLLAQSPEDRLALLAFCVGLSVSAVHTKGQSARTLAHSDELATTLDLDMRAYWAATANGYFDRVPKALILEAVREGASVEAARRIADFKKVDMASAAENLLAGSGWLPALLRPPVSEAHENPIIELEARAAE